jgi:hypothetical protein
MAEDIKNESPERDNQNPDNQELYSLQAVIELMDADVPVDFKGLPDDLFKLMERLPEGTKLIHETNIYRKDEKGELRTDGLIKILRLCPPIRSEERKLGDIESKFANEIFAFVNYGNLSLQMYIDSQDHNVKMTKKTLNFEDHLKTYVGPKISSVSFINMPDNIIQATKMLGNMIPLMPQIMRRVNALGLDKTQQIHSIMIFPDNLKYVIKQFNSQIRVMMQSVTKFDLHSKTSEDTGSALTNIINEIIVSEEQ